jgi:hypothetical protein
MALMGAVLLGWAARMPAQVELPAAAKEVVKQFEDEAADVDRKIDVEVKKRVEKTAVELKKLQDVFCKEAKLDEAVAIRDLIRALRAGTNGPLPADLPAAAREVYKEHEDAVAEIEKKVEAEFKKKQERILAELKKMQDLFCKDAKLDEAVAVRDLIRSIREGVAAAGDPGYINNGADDIGKVFYYEVTGVTTGQSIWGSDIYTTGSHLGMAAVHCGLLKPDQVGVVKVTILPGQASYEATTRNGVTSSPYGTWGVSFKVERGYRSLAKPRPRPVPLEPTKATRATFVESR